MLRVSILTAALLAAFPMAAHAASDPDLAAIREEIKALKAAYEKLEQKLQAAEAAAQAPVPPPAPVPAAAPAAANAFNPAIALVLGGTMNNLSRDPATYAIAGFKPVGGEIGPGKRGVNLGESELTLMASVDPMFSGQLTFSLGAENEASVEESFIQLRDKNLKFGRFLSSVGYLNNQHQHTWDFTDAPLAYQAFLGGQLKTDGFQYKWLAPSDTFIELGAEAGGSGKNGFASRALYAHVGDDIGVSGSWRAGLSYLQLGASDDGAIAKSNLLIADAIYKWSPNGNSTAQNFKLQGEYFQRKEEGAARQSGWYAQAVYQFMPGWRSGLRYDLLQPKLGVQPKRSSLMFDYSPSEFSRLRLQLARDEARGNVVDNQIFLQYIMSLGAHAAHTF